MRSPEGPLADLPLHFVLLFPEDFPASGPEIRLFHALPHPNVSAHPAGAAQGAPYRLAYWDCNASITQWCAHLGCLCIGGRVGGPQRGWRAGVLRQACAPPASDLS